MGPVGYFESTTNIVASPAIFMIIWGVTSGTFSIKVKTKNNLTEYEEQMLINIVSELKMNFIEVKQSIENVNGTSLSMKKNKKK